MNEFKVTLERFKSGIFWRLEKDGLEMTNWTFTKWGAKRQINREIRLWNKRPIFETYTIRGKN